MPQLPFLRPLSRLLPILSVPLWLACQSTDSEQKSATATPPAAADSAVGTSPAPPAQAQVLARQFGPFLRGAWVNTEYLTAVNKTKSPILAADRAGRVSEMDISLAGQAGDSLEVILGLGNHEGDDMTIYFRPGLQATSLPTNYLDYKEPSNFTEISYVLGPGDTMLVLTTYSKARQIVDRSSFRRVPGVQPGKLDGLNAAVNSLLFAGRYAGIDSVGKPVQLQFTASGQLRGLAGVDAYYTSTDFGVGPGNDIDNITFKNKDTPVRTLGFQHRADSVRLFATKLVFDKDSVETLVRGRVLYKLKRR
ncbi:hypothetical protein [Hymenobacter lucidus]|uniref:DUF4292 domain-containing protein n=1 Tax=Hymenobacter lucidus TaxID=2880930 RepID=A0ABS8AY88_9BACT|nr:hypothetical protein [Hymenobacter lucidus]MCB2410785.1 hypothetical protein [Hymenobacter lucidus]